MKNLNRIFLFIICVGLFIIPATAQSVSNFDATNLESVQKNIISQYEKSGVRVKSYWFFMNTKTNEPFFFLFVPVKTLKQKGIQVNSQAEAVPVYVETDNGSYEPILVANKSKFNEAVGHIASVGGLPVTKDGFVATSSWVIAPWNAAVRIGNYSVPNGIVVSADLKRVVNVDAPPPTNWIPSKTKAQRGTIANLGIKADFNPENTRNKIELEVATSAPGKSLPAQLVSTSNKHDVGLIKVKPAGELNTFELYDNYDLIKKGSTDNFILHADLEGKLEAMKTLVTATSSDEMGTTIQLVNDFSATEKEKKEMTQRMFTVFGNGNSGMPIFNSKGRVIGMYLGYNDKTHTHNVIPIRFVKELLN